MAVACRVPEEPPAERCRAWDDNEKEGFQDHESREPHGESHDEPEIASYPISSGGVETRVASRA